MPRRGIVFSQYLFTGKERDSESGNDYFGARYYGGWPTLSQPLKVGAPSFRVFAEGWESTDLSSQVF
jgi:hypothetical protein